MSYPSTVPLTVPLIRPLSIHPFNLNHLPNMDIVMNLFGYMRVNSHCGPGKSVADVVVFLSCIGTVDSNLCFHYPSRS